MEKKPKKLKSYREHKHSMEYCAKCAHKTCTSASKDLSQHTPDCELQPKKPKYPYWSQYQIWREKCHAHDGILDEKTRKNFEAEIFEKFITENIKVAMEKGKTNIPFRGKIN